MTIKRWLIFLSVFIIVLMVHLVTFISVMKFLSQWSERGQFGDVFGFTGSLFSGLAFAFFLTNYWYQSDQIEIVKKEATQREKEARFERGLALLTVLKDTYDREISRSSRTSGGALGAKEDERLRLLQSRVAEIALTIDSVYDEALTSIRGDHVR